MIHVHTCNIPYNSKTITHKCRMRLFTKSPTNGCFWHECKIMLQYFLRNSTIESCSLLTNLSTLEFSKTLIVWILIGFFNQRSLFLKEKQFIFASKMTLVSRISNDFESPYLKFVQNKRNFYFWPNAIMNSYWRICMPIFHKD